MGLELHGLNPKNHSGKIYRSSIWIWHPMWNYFEINYPEIVNNLDGHSNSNKTLQQDESEKLSSIILSDIQNGKVSEYLKEYDLFIDSLPEVRCEYCLGFGFERKHIMFQLEDVCFRCRGTGVSKMFITNYRAYVHDFYMLSVFLNNCGGFKIL